MKRNLDMIVFFYSKHTAVKKVEAGYNPSHSTETLIGYTAY